LRFSNEYNPPVFVIGGKDVDDALNIQSLCPLFVDGQQRQVAVSGVTAAVP
jgi:hypothetical protein